MSGYIAGVRIDESKTNSEQKNHKIVLNCFKLCIVLSCNGGHLIYWHSNINAVILTILEYCITDLAIFCFDGEVIMIVSYRISDLEENTFQSNEKLIKDLRIH